jgi:hypothetical protein
MTNKPITWMRSDWERQFNEQNALLEAEGEEPITQLEFLQCRLEDAQEKIGRVEALLPKWRSRRYEHPVSPRIGEFALAEEYESGRNDQDIACASELEQTLKGQP